MSSQSRSTRIRMRATAVVVFASTGLLTLSTTPSAHALVAPSAAPHQRPLRRTALPSPSRPDSRADRTVLRYIDERTADADRTVLHYIHKRTAADAYAEPVLRGDDAWTLSSLREQAKTIKQRDRRDYFDFVASNVESAAPDSVLPPQPRQRLDPPGAAPGPAPPSSLLSSLPSSVAALWTQARTVAEDDRRLYFDFVQHQSQDDHLATVPGPSGGPGATNQNSIKIDAWW